jgi:pimeloyl-ACP methyl ester carboxylesterase
VKWALKKSWKSADKEQFRGKGQQQTLLTDPESHSGDAVDAFDVVVPSLPGYGFSDPLPPGESGRIPEMWAHLMADVLGYERFAAHGGDIGGMVTNRLGVEFSERLVGIHVTFVAEPYVGPGAPEPSEQEQAFLEERARGKETSSYALNDSPVGLAAWIVEKWREWSDCGGDIERRFTKDELLTTVTLYWATRTISSSFNIYRDWALGSASVPVAWEGREEVPPGVDSKPLDRGQRIEVPAAVAAFNERCPREWVERAYADLRRFTEMPRGGHFAAMEEPELLAEDIRSFFRPLR